MGKVLLIGLVFISCGVSAQNDPRIGVYTGAGLPDLIALGGKYQKGQLEGGLYYGTNPFYNSDPDNSLYTTGGHFIWHFGGTSNHLVARPWYLRTDLIYYFEENRRYIWHIVASGFRIGREFAFTEKLSVQFDLGTAFYLSEKQITKDATGGSGWDISPDLPFLPAGSIIFFAGW